MDALEDQFELIQFLENQLKECERDYNSDGMGFDIEYTIQNDTVMDLVYGFVSYEEHEWTRIKVEFLGDGSITAIGDCDGYSVYDDGHGHEYDISHRFKNIDELLMWLESEM